jgi:hypothetical protein
LRSSLSCLNVGARCVVHRSAVHRSAVLTCAAMLAIWVPASSRAGDAETEALKHLPLDASIARVPRAAGAVPASSEPVAYETPMGLLFVYKKAGSLFLRQVGRAGEAPPDVSLPGEFVARMDSTADGILVQKIASTGESQVIVVTSDGASAGSYFNVLEQTRGLLTDATRGNPIGGASFALDCGLGGGCRVIAYGKWTELSNCWVRTYDWLGASLAETDSDSPKYALSRTAVLKNRSASLDAMPVFERVAVTFLAVRKYLDQRLPSEAVQLCGRVLDLLDDPSRSIKRTPAIPSPMQEEQFAEDIRRGKGLVHNLLGESYEASGSAAQAGAEFRKAAELGARAARK